MDKNIQIDKKMGLAAFIPLFVFLILFLGSGLIFTALGMELPWKQFPRHVALLFAIFVGLLMNSGMKMGDKVDNFCVSAGKPGIMLMCLIFFLAGGFSGVCKATGGMTSAVNLGLTIIPAKFMLPGIFVISAFISTAIGTSNGTVLAVAPIAIEVALSIGAPVPPYVAAVCCGAWFGDNLSIISDTTIAATRGVGAEMRDKFIMNFKIAIPPAIATLIVFAFIGGRHSIGALPAGLDYNLINIIPYAFIIIAALCGMDVLLVLFLGIMIAGALGIVTSAITPLGFVQAIGSGMEGMMSTAIVAILIQGLIGFVIQNGGMQWLIESMAKRIKTRKGAEFSIAALTTVLSFALVNNTSGIIAAAPLAKEVGEKYNIAPKRNASLLDIFGSFGNALAPHGNSLLAACALYVGLEPLGVMKFVVYPLFLAISAAITIAFGIMRTKEEKEADNALKAAK